MKLLSYNTQRGARGLELVTRLLADDSLDMCCFQRFPQAWLGRWGAGWAGAHQPAFDGADNGCVTLTRDARESRLGLTRETPFADQNQSAAYVITSLRDFAVINTLPPFPEGEVTAADYARHIAGVRTVLPPRAAVVVGDFHFDGVDLARLGASVGADFGPLRCFSREKNFYGAHLEFSNLTKLLANVEVRMLAETVTDLEREPVTHLPVTYEFELA